MTLPNFFIIGPGKTGSSSLHEYLAQHPQVFMSAIKEPRFFQFDGMPEAPPGVVSNLDDYEALFADAGDAKAIGESSITYFGSEHAARRILARVPKARLVSVLRQPVDAAYSAFVMWSRSGHDMAPNFAHRMAAERAGNMEGAPHAYLYKRRPLSERLKPYLDIFPRAQIHLALYDDFVADLFTFLDVDPTFEPDMRVRSNAGGSHRNPLIGALLRRPNPVRFLARRLVPDAWRERGRKRIVAGNLKPVPPLDPELRTELNEVVREDVGRLQDLLGRDLSHWLR